MIERVAGLEHRGCVGTTLDEGPMLRLQDYLQNGFPIQNLTIICDLLCVVLGGLVPISDSTVFAGPSATSRRSGLNRSHRSTTRLSSWVALISP